jgi:hypothetical protein
MIMGLLVMGCGNHNNNTVYTVEFELDDEGFSQLATNDPENYGYVLWGVESEEIAVPNVYELECKKISGYEECGYGMVFETSHENKEKFYAVLISADGYYTIFKSVGTELEDETIITDWVESDTINTGYNELNKIKVIKADSTYTVYINDIEVDEFTDADDFGDNIGLYVEVGYEDEESFPQIPVDVRFKLKLK